MHAIDLLARHLDPSGAEPLPETPRDGVCCVTGSHGPSIARGHLFGDSFRDQAALAALDSDRVSVACWTVLTWHEDRGKKRLFYPERQSSWICDERGFRTLSRADVRELVLAGSAGPPWAAYCTTSYKKHGALYAPVNGVGRAVWQWEQERVDATDLALVKRMWERLIAMRTAGVSTMALVTLSASPRDMRACGPRAWMEFARWAMPRHRSALYRFLVYLLPSQEKKEMSNGESE